MASIKSTLALEDKMTKTLESIDRASKSTERTMANVDMRVQTLDRNMTQASASATGFLKSLLGFTAVRAIFSMITNQLDSAISRFDTMNNYPRVLANLGLSAEDAAESISIMENHLIGLPTRLDEATVGVQRFIAANGNVKASTAMWLAMNDAILAGGANEMTRSAAIEQLTQAYAKGKPEMQEWKSLQQAMPGQLQQIAKAMGYVSSSALYDALKSGNTTMNEFTKTIVQLDEQGIDGFANFHEQALTATDGIGTAITNMKTAVSKGLKDMIENINTTLTNAGLPTIQKMIENTGKTIRSTLQTIGTVAGRIISFVARNLTWIKPLLVGIVSIMLAYKTVTIALTVAQGIRNAITAIQIVTAYNEAAALLANVNATLLATSSEYALAVATAEATVAQGGLAAAVWATLWPIAAVVAAVFLLIGALNYINQQINGNEAKTISAVGVIMAYLNMLKAYVLNRYVVPVWNSIATLVNFFANCWKDPITAVEILFAEMADNVIGYFENILKSLVDIINKIIGGVNQVADKVGGHINELNVDGISNFRKDLQSEISAMKSGMGWEDVVQKIDYVNYADAMEEGYNWGANFGLGAASGLDDMNGLGDIDWDNLNNTIGTDSAGGKAVKTTTNDKLLSDEDIQLLLDVATRDYKLNYQKVEPNITITFGDIRETADVDDIMDAVADRLEEIYDGNLEVVKE